MLHSKLAQVFPGHTSVKDFPEKTNLFDEAMAKFNIPSLPTLVAIGELTSNTLFHYVQIGKMKVSHWLHHHSIHWATLCLLLHWYQITLCHLSSPIYPIQYCPSHFSFPTQKEKIRGFLDHPSDHFCMEFCRISSCKKLTCQLRYQGKSWISVHG